MTLKEPDTAAAGHYTSILLAESFDGALQVPAGREPKFFNHLPHFALEWHSTKWFLSSKTSPKASNQSFHLKQTSKPRCIQHLRVLPDSKQIPDCRLDHSALSTRLPSFPVPILIPGVAFLVTAV